MSLTVLTPTWNTDIPLELMMRSMDLYHERLPWWVWEDGSTDNTLDVIRGRADRTFTGSNDGFCVAVETMIPLVETSCVAVVESDVEFLGPALTKMTRHLEEFEAFSVSAPWWGPSDHRRLDHSCVVFNTAKIKKVLECFSFLPFIQVFLNRQLYHDSGAFIRRAAEFSGWRCEEPDWIRKEVVHYGGLSRKAKGDTDPQILSRWDSAQRRLEDIRKGVQNKDGLQWDEMVWYDGKPGWRVLN